MNKISNNDLLDAIREHEEETAEELALFSLSCEKESGGDVCYLITRDGFPGENGKAVLRDLFETMLDQRCCPQYILLIDTAVKLLFSDSPFLRILKELDQNGAAVFASSASAECYREEGGIDEYYLAPTGKLLTIMHRAKKVITI